MELGFFHIMYLQWHILNNTLFPNPFASARQLYSIDAHGPHFLSFARERESVRLV